MSELINDNINPRFLAYLKYLGLDISQHEQVKNYEYISWINKKWLEFDELNKNNKEYLPSYRTSEDHKNFDKWLFADVEKNKLTNF